MHIERTRHIDCSEPDATGGYDYYYEYDVYRFTDVSHCLTARSYTDEPGEAHFLSMETHGRRRTLVDADLANPLFQLAQSYLRGQGKTRMHWLSGRGNGYEPVPVPVLPPPGG
ncbi:MAG: hypothetical protein EOO31_00370 [Comamonadaceae bacterium]|nr:MAG: hypothetical protein EOO31_00370 [Comamonadaceae bacterium]